MRKQQANTAELLLEWHGLTLEFDSVVAQNMRPEVGLGASLYIGMPEFEDNLGIANRKAVLVRNPSAQDEGVVVQSEIFRINEEHFSDLDRLRLEPGPRELDAVLFGRLAHYFAEIKKALTRNEFVGPQNQFATEVLDLMERHPVGIVPWLELRDTPHPTGG